MSDASAILASPLTIIERVEDSKDIAAILKLAGERGAERIIAGLPLSMDGTARSQAEKVQRFVEKLRHETNIPIEYRDERFTTVTAIQLKREAAGKRFKPRIRVDAMAAAVILQSYLDEKLPENQPQPE
jgi:putative Holliday junction resolvase